MSSGYKLAVLGDRESILGYRTLGFHVREAENEADGRRELRRACRCGGGRQLSDLAKEGYAVIYVTEQLACRIEDEIAKYKDSPLPAIILIPGKTGSLGIGMKGVHSAVERAVGADILA